MTALILVVDDVPANVKLLEVKLNNEYYDVITARDGFEGLAKAKEHKPDLVLLDVMMPGMDGFETCRRMKADVSISHIPVVMVTALSESSDRVSGLDAGADDFLTKPINDTALLARVRSLVRMKVLLDELRLRDKTGLQMGVLKENSNSFTSDVSGSTVVLIDDDLVQSRKIRETLESTYKVVTIDHPEETLARLMQMPEVDIIIVSMLLSEVDGLRLAAHLRNVDALRHVPFVMLVDEEDRHVMLKGLDLGINDYLMLPIDHNEMAARVKTQIRRKKYQDALKANYQASISMAITDQLTGLYNRHYLDAHLQNMVNNAVSNNKPLSLLIMDMDHFKHVNDTYGHSAGDEVLQQLAHMIIHSVRSSDLAARLGGEEFVILMPETMLEAAHGLAERIRHTVEQTPFVINHEVKSIMKTISLGVSTLIPGQDTAMELIKRADSALYESKNNGRNRVTPVLNVSRESMLRLAVETGF